MATPDPDHFSKHIGVDAAHATTEGIRDRRVESQGVWLGAF